VATDWALVDKMTTGIMAVLGGYPCTPSNVAHAIVALQVCAAKQTQLSAPAITCEEFLDGAHTLWHCVEGVDDIRDIPKIAVVVHSSATMGEG
jgi:hypothetical protein